MRRFRRQGLAVTEAANGADALEKATQTRCDVALLDLHLPDQSGIDLLAKLKEQQPELEALMLTAHGSIETAIEAMKRGAFDYLIKPLDLERLTQVIERAFEAARLMAVPAVLPVEDPSDQIVGRATAIALSVDLNHHWLPRWARFFSSLP